MYIAEPILKICGMHENGTDIPLIKMGDGYIHLAAAEVKELQRQSWLTTNMPSCICSIRRTNGAMNVWQNILE